MKIIWTPLGSKDRDDVYDFIEAENPSAAIAMDANVDKQLLQLALHPKLGCPGRIVGTREFIVHPRYMIIYDIKADHIRVLRLLHTARQWPPRKR